MAKTILPIPRLQGELVNLARASKALRAFSLDADDRQRRISRALAMSSSISPPRIRVHATRNLVLQSSRSMPSPLSLLSDG
jgi:hypothetical protein